MWHLLTVAFCSLQIIDRDRRDAEDPWELRARREKQEFRKERDYHWQVTQAMDHWQMLNHPPEDQTDVRIMEKLCASNAPASRVPLWMSTCSTAQALRLTQHSSWPMSSIFSHAPTLEVCQDGLVPVLQCILSHHLGPV